MNNVVRRLLRSGLKSRGERQKYILVMVATSVNFSHTMRCHITGQSKDNPCTGPGCCSASPYIEQSNFRHVQSSHETKNLHSFIRPRICPLCSVYPSTKTKYLHMSLSLCAFCLLTVLLHPSTFLQVLPSFVFTPGSHFRILCLLHVGINSCQYVNVLFILRYFSKHSQNTN
jgi:hypothetical protein